jgi:hypothetical protein
MVNMRLKVLLSLQIPSDIHNVLSQAKPLLKLFDRVHNN